MNWAAQSLIHAHAQVGVERLPAGLGDAPALLPVRDDDEPLALGEASRGHVLGQPRDLLEDLALDRGVLESAHRPALHDELGELHPTASSQHAHDMVCTCTPSARRSS